MPTLSASDYTTYLKFKAASISPIKPNIQTRDNVSLSQSVINANVLASQAAFVVTPSTTTVGTLQVTVSTASTNILSGATADGVVITYACSQAHGLTDGDTVTVTGFTGDLVPTPNQTGVVTVVDTTSFTIPDGTAPTGAATGTGSITGRVYYTTSAAHLLVAGQQNITVVGLSTSAFDFTLAPIFSVPSADTFVISSTSTGAAATSQSAPITVTVYANTQVGIRGLARVQPVQPMRTNNPNALSTLSGSGTMSSSAISRPGGLPVGFRGSQGTYYNPAQLSGWKNAGPPGH